MKQYRTVLSIAGSDPSSGAGIQADLKTIASLGCYGMTVITALTAQSTSGVSGIFPVPTDFVTAQFEALKADIEIDAIKIGMLYDSDIINAVYTCLKSCPDIPVILDPVMVATSGDRLLSGDAIATLKKQLFPLATLITPNLKEACVLVNQTHYHPDMLSALNSLGAKHTLIKDIYPIDRLCRDVLQNNRSNDTLILEQPRIQTVNTHGTGCTLSAAITSFIALGFSTEEAVIKAKDYITKAI
jgi:hydroxymethylpyrimidine/phosphomethylpyrimidine kinase